VVYMSLFAIIGLMFGAKALAVLTFWVQAVVYWGEIANAGFGLWDVIVASFTESGIVFFGGLIGGIFGGLVYIKMYKLSAPVFVDLVAPCVPLAHAIGRVGCFLAGCCYGIESNLGVNFDRSPAAPHDVRLLPIQLIEANVNLLLVVVILIYEHKKKQKNGEGKSLLLYLALYSVSRFTLEFFRGDAVRGVYFGVSTSQIISVCLFVFAAALFFKNNKNINK